MALEFSGNPELKWHKVKNKDGQLEDRLCICITVRNTGARAETAKIAFRSYGMSPPGHGEDELCKDVEVTVGAHGSEEACCCEHEGLLRNALHNSGSFLISSSDVDKDVRIDGEKLTIPKKPKAND